MSNPWRNKSLPLFILVFCSFFSCQQYIDLIKPHLPKPKEETCQLLKESQGTLGSTRSYMYDSKGRVSKIINDPNPSDVNPERFVTDTLIYNASNQIIKQVNTRHRRGFERVFEYDSKGRVTKDVTTNYFNLDPTVTNEYTYTANTIKVKTTFTHPLEETRTREYTYFFEGENLVRIEVAPSVVIALYEYNTTINKLSTLEKQLAYINGFTSEGRATFSPFMSKNLVSREENPSGGIVTGYTWELNTEGYPVKRSMINRFGYFEVLYEYNCGKK